MNDLFEIPTPLRMSRELDQFMTPRWAAQAIVDEFYPDLDAEDFVIEPSCGDGAFIEAVPDHVPVIGVDIDPGMVRAAKANTGRQILDGDYRTIKLPYRPTLVLGNPPYKVRLIDEFLERSHELLVPYGRVGFLMSTHAVQTPSTVLRWNERWSLDQRIIPRTLFPRAIRPLVFLMFTKDVRRLMLGGFALYRQCADVGDMPSAVKALLVRGIPGKPVWRAVVEWALRQLGGIAHLSDLYAQIAPRRPTQNPWWQEKVRQTLQRHFRRLGGGRWGLEVPCPA